MLLDVMLAIGIPLILLILAMLALEHWQHRLPAWLQGVSRRRSWLWNTGLALIIGLSFLRWLLQR